MFIFIVVITLFMAKVLIDLEFFVLRPLAVKDWNTIPSLTQGRDI
jgi:hypothetical protein